MHKITLFLVLCFFAFAGSASARPLYSGGACVFSQTAGSAGDTSGLELRVSASGKGIFIDQIRVVGSATHGVRISAVTLLDIGTATVAPTFVYGDFPLTTVVIKGRNDAGLILGEGDFFIVTAATATQVPSRWYVPPGKFVTVLVDTVAGASDVLICFTELQ